MEDSTRLGNAIQRSAPYASSCSPPAYFNKAQHDRLQASSSLHSNGFNSSFGSRFGGRHPVLASHGSGDVQATHDMFLHVPPSPSVSEGLTDSPSSVSSISSFRRGDLADIEDLDLEPELETVSECDEESSSLCSMDLTAELDSDSEHTGVQGLEGEHLGLGLHPNGTRPTSLKALSSGSPASDYARRKRSEWYLNNYANKIAARRPRKVKKGRITEIVEEGTGDINTTIMPKPASACPTTEWTCEVGGPPVQPPRSVSPSDTVPTVPSPLSECLNAEGANIGSKMEDSVETVRLTTNGDSAAKDAVGAKDASERPETSVGRSPSPSYAPPTSMPRGRRASSPPRLRPCFRRRTSAQSVASTRESSCEREPTRGRSVRFSAGPPQELRTHSPVEYDRKSCPVNNRLSTEDLEELRTLKMEMGLLEAKWAAVAACKLPSSQSEGLSSAAHNAGVAAMSAARSSLHDKGSESDSATRPAPHMPTAARIRLERERERERERQRNMPRYNRSNLPNRGVYDCDSVRSKFGLAPPPPLPGVALPSSRSGSPRQTLTPSIGRSPSAERSCYLSVPQLPDGSPAMTARNDPPKLLHTGPTPPVSPVDGQCGRDAGRRLSYTAPGTSPQAKDQYLSVLGYDSPARGRQPGPSPKLGGASNDALGLSTSISASSSSTSSSNDKSPPRPINMPASWTPPCQSPSKTPSSYPMMGSDGPAGEFYESGSEYDLVC